MTEMENGVLYNRLVMRKWEYKYDMYSHYFNGFSRENEESGLKISVIIVSNEIEDDTVQCLKTLREQQHSNAEIIFVSNGLVDDQIEKLKSYADCIVYLRENTGAYISRNFGALFAESPLVVFVDDDALPEYGFISGHLRAHQTFDIISARGIVRPKSESRFNEYARHYDFGPNTFPRFVDVEGNASYEAETFFRLGGWNDAIYFGHGGVELAYRIGTLLPDPSKQIYVPWPVIRHNYAKSDMHLGLKRQKQILAWRYLETMHPDIELFVRQWEQYKQRNDLVRLRNTSNNRDADSLLNLAEFYRQKGNLEKAEIYITQYKQAKSANSR